MAETVADPDDIPSSEAALLRMLEEQNANIMTDVKVGVPSWPPLLTSQPTQRSGERSRTGSGGVNVVLAIGAQPPQHHRLPH
jgi:hypothetical protein